ncbi:putative thioesterase [Cytobacillus eiseniae]|uniref:Thioesterase n=1 Tax=Cytobacillus eiseniae TaxID=762947 RepID=A0ABS4RKK8_9BACI|nr:thioesterase [Cytobacillus eiseniae]MBP2242327.1 putative thioesterase [Cytobacillus eiseniae]
MRPGLKIGDQAELKIIVTPDMFAQFDGKVVHRAYSTVSMIYHMEWVSRMIILPFLEEDEEGMGAAVSAKHLAPSAEGAELVILAIVNEVKGSHVITEVTVSNRGKLIGMGEVKQILLPKSKIASLLEDD